jgi:hypothetical protein
MASSRFNSIATARSSNEETSGSLCDRERFQIRAHDASLEQTTDSQEKAVEDATLKDLLKPPPSPKKNAVKPDVILVTSFGGPSEPKRHVSLIFCHVLPECYLSVAPEDESKCLHLGLPSNSKSRCLILVLLVQPIIKGLSKICRNYIALEKENQRLSAELDNLRRK